MGILPKFVVNKRLPAFKGVQLLGGKTLMYGKNVSESKKKTLRTWSPNIQTKHLFSSALNRTLHIQLTTSCLRNIKKWGGLDTYLFKTKPEELGEKGMWLRRSVIAAHATRKARELPCVPEATPEQPNRPVS